MTHVDAGARNVRVAHRLPGRLRVQNRSQALEVLRIQLLEKPPDQGFVLESAIRGPSPVLLLLGRLLREPATVFVANDPAARRIAEVRADDEHVGIGEIVDELTRVRRAIA